MKHIIIGITILLFVGVGFFGKLRALFDGGRRSPTPPPVSVSTSTPGSTSPTNAKLLFRSGFEDGVVLDSPKIDGDGWSQFLHGGDAGYAWEEVLSRGIPKNRFTYLVSSRQNNLSTFVNTRIETVTGRDGKPTRALMSELVRQDPTPFIENTRNQYGFYPEPTDKQAYIRHWIKLQPDLGTVILPLGETHSRQLMEWKETGPPGARADFRWNINVRRSKGVDDLYWWTNAQFGDLANSPKAWDCRSTGVPVPVDEWFLFEVFWKLDTTDGRVWAAVNGKTIVDYHGQTQKDSGLFVWWPFKVYTGGQIDTMPDAPGYRSIYQWVDDVEIWSDFPVSATKPHMGAFSCETF